MYVLHEENICKDNRPFGSITNYLKASEYIETNSKSTG